MISPLAGGPVLAHGVPMDTSRDPADPADQRELDTDASTGPHGPFRDPAEPTEAETPGPPTSCSQVPDHDDTWEPL